MPAREPRTEGRVVRKALLESERWLTLKDNADRLAYVWLLLNVDDFANYSAERYRLMRAWRDFGITTVELVSKTLSELQDHDMIGLYDIDGRPFVHIQRFHNTRQYWTRIYPKSPFESDKENEQKQRVTEKRIKHVLDTSKQGVRGNTRKPTRQPRAPPAPLCEYSTSNEIRKDVSKVEKSYVKPTSKPSR